LPTGIATPTSTSSPPSVQLQASAPPTEGITLTKNHQLWDNSEDIRVLQKFFNTHGFIIATSGPGSPGSETSIFGTHTYQALIKFQQANNLPRTGYLGPLTEAALALPMSATSTTQ
jgi:peptidoglycan hydrolase-like protein with peptidoglycan-binding domain